MKIKLSNFYKPTPKKWRKIGDSILITSTFVTSGSLIAYDQLKEVYAPKTIKVVIGVFLVLGVTAKFLTNLFKTSDEV